MTRILNGNAAPATMLGMGTNKVGFCLQTVAKAYGNPSSIGPGPHPVEYAIDAWTWSTGQHPGDRNPPVGVPVFFGVSSSRTDIDKAAGDVTISLGGGRLVATDYPYAGHIGITTIAAREIQTRRPYKGWVDVFLGYQIAFIGAAAENATLITPTKPVPPTQEELDDMAATKDASIVRNYTRENGGKACTALIYPDGSAVMLNDTQDIDSAVVAHLQVYGIARTDTGNPQPTVRGQYGSQLNEAEWVAFWSHFPGKMLPDAAAFK